MEPSESDDDSPLYFDSFDFFVSDETLTVDSPSPKTPDSPFAEILDQTPTLKSSSSETLNLNSSNRRRIRRRRLLSAADDGDSGDRHVTASTTTDTASAANTPPVEIPTESFLASAAAFIINAVLFQFKLICTLFSIPVKSLRFMISALTDPFGTLFRSIGIIKSSLFAGVESFVSRYEFGQLALRVALGCFWSGYVAFVLMGILVMAFVSAGFFMRLVVEEPLRVERSLSFDYTKPSPAAVVPLDWGRGTVPHLSRRLQLDISLTLPESEYNQHLGVFQVKAEFLSENGKVTYSSSRPCMLRYKSSYIRIIQTLLRSLSLLSGYSSESQNIRIKMNGLIEGTEPTAFIRLILEQRAEYGPGAGIPQIYAASLKVESELPFLKRILWNWRRTIFIWIAMGLFIFEILFVLLCCRPLVIPYRRSAAEAPTGT